MWISHYYAKQWIMSDSKHVRCFCRDQQVVNMPNLPCGRKLWFLLEDEYSVQGSHVTWDGRLTKERDVLWIDREDWKLKVKTHMHIEANLLYLECTILSASVQTLLSQIRLSLLNWIAVSENSLEINSPVQTLKLGNPQWKLPLKLSNLFSVIKASLKLAMTLACYHYVSPRWSPYTQ